MGLRAVLVLAAAFAIASGVRASAPPLQAAVSFVTSAQRPDGGFGEAGSPADASLTAWASLALVAGNAPGGVRAGALAYLQAHESAPATNTEAALEALARTALGDHPAALLARLRRVRAGPLVNDAIWAVLALRSAREAAPPELVQALVSARQAAGWSWLENGKPDSNDTAAALEALRAAGVTGRPIARGAAALQRFRNQDGGYALERGRPSDAQSTAWAIQALLAVGQKPGRATWRFLAGLRRPDGSYRFSRRYTTTPVWVTAQVVPALAGKPFPLTGPASPR